MKATQDNAEWVSNTYKQGATEDNWAAVSAKYRVPRNVLMPATTSTTSATVLSTTDGITAGDSLFLYNSTDGYVDYTVSGLALESAGSTPPTLSQSSYINEHTLFDGTDERLKCWNNDGTRCFTYNTTGGVVKEYAAPRPWDIRGSSSGGCTAVTAHNLDYTGYTLRVTSGTTCVFSTGGEYFFMMDTYSHYICRWKLSTLYDLSTAGSVTVYDVGQESSGKWVSILRSFDSNARTDELAAGGFGGLGFSEDGKKGFLFRCDNKQGNDSMDHNTIWSFELATPFDFDSVTTAKYSEMGFSPSTTWTNLHAVFSPDGKVIYSVRSTTSNLRPEKRVLATAWDAESTYSNVGYNISNYYSRVDYYYGNCITMASDGSIFSVENDRRWFYNESSETDIAWNRTTFNTTSASLTTAPTLLGAQGQNISDIKYAALTRADADQEGKSLVVSKESTATSLVVYPPSDAQGSTALNNKKLKIDGAEFTVSSTTFTDDVFSTLNASVSSARSGNTRGSDAESTARFVGAFQFDDPGARPGLSPSTYYNAQGMAFSTDGTKFFVQGYQDNTNFTPLGGPSTGGDDSIVEWDLSTPWDLSTATYSNVHDGGSFRGESPSVSIGYEALDFAFSDDGTIMYVMHNSSGTSYLFQGTLSKPFDPSTWTYSQHISLYSLLSNLNFIYSFAISNDGRAIVVFYSSSSGTLTSESYTKSRYIQLATPWDISSATDKGQWSSYRAYRSSLFGDSQYGYSSFGINRAADHNFSEFLSVGSLSADLTSKSDMVDQAFDMSLIENWVDNIYTNNPAGKTIVVDGGTKMYVHIPQEHRVAMFTGAFGNFADKHVIDITSLGLSGPQPKHVEFAAPASFTSMGSTSILSNTNLYKEYATPEVAIDAEALKFKIEGDTGAEVSRFNADLFT